MTKVFLVTNSLYKYRISIYIEFIERFKSEMIELRIIVVSNWKINKNDLNQNFIQIGSSSFNLIKYLNYEKPDIILTFLSPSNISIWLLYLYAYFMRIPLIFWSHGINLQDPNNRLKLFIYNILHNFSSSIILYTKNELKFIKSKYHYKIFIANNTINFNAIPKIIETKDQLKKKYNIAFKKIVLFVGRIQRNKRLNVLLEIFNNPDFNDFALLIVGPNLDGKYQDLIKKKNNIFYFGEIYDDQIINEIFKLSDIFCIPGANGLGLNQAMYWGLPCVALNVRHGPEIIYLKNYQNGFIVNNQKELSKKLILLLSNDKIRKHFSNKAKRIIMKEADIKIMYKGFLNAINYVHNLNK